MQLAHNEGEFETKTEKEEAIEMEGNKPEKKFRAGAVSATVWNNHGTRKTGEVAEFKTVSIERSYKDKSNQWKSTTSFRAMDLPRLTLVVNKAFEYLSMRNDYTVEEEVVV